MTRRRFVNGGFDMARVLDPFWGADPYALVSCPARHGRLRARSLEGLKSSFYPLSEIGPIVAGFTDANDQRFEPIRKMAVRYVGQDA